MAKNIKATYLTASEKSVKEIINQLTNLYLKHRSRISRAAYLTLFIALLNRIRVAVKSQKADANRSSHIAEEKGVVKKKRVELNREFFRSLIRLLKICIPGWKSQELRLLISHTVFLVLRTLISLYVAELDGKLVSSLVRGKARQFLGGLVWWMMVAIPATFTNSMVCPLY